MPDLATEPVRAWVAAAYPQLSAEDWPLPIRAIEEPAAHQGLLAALGVALEAAGAAEGQGWNPGHSLDRLRPVLAQCGAARLLRFLHWTLEADLPDAPRMTSLLAEGDGPEARAIAAALRAVALRNTLNRMFSPARVAELEAACAATEEAST